MPGRLSFDREVLAEICQRRHVRQLSLFGSVLKGVEHTNSDVDLLVEEVDLVQEQDDWFFLEPFAVDKGLEEHHGFMHLVLQMNQDPRFSRRAARHTAVWSSTRH